MKLHVYTVCPGLTYTVIYYIGIQGALLNKYLVIFTVRSLQCYVCNNQDGNEEKCLYTIKTCAYNEDRYTVKKCLLFVETSHKN
jgi:hypothetical protein